MTVFVCCIWRGIKLAKDEGKFDILPQFDASVAVMHAMNVFRFIFKEHIANYYMRFMQSMNMICRFGLENK